MSISKNKTLQQQTYEYLKESILSDKFSYNQIYSETKLSKEIGVSRTPMRDALHRLNQEKLIDILPSKGFILHKLTHNDVIEVFQMRCAIEGFCALSLCREFNTKKGIEYINKLESILSFQKNILNTTKNIYEFVEYDTLFHSTIVEFIDNSEFNNIFNNYIYRIKKLAINSLSHPNRIESTFNEHCDIFNCIKNGDLKSIYNVTISHMSAPIDISLNLY